MAKLLVIGLDGMDYFIARRTIKNHHFKNFNPILKKQLVREAETGPSWASFYTGLNKEIHGVTDGWGRNLEGSNTFKDIQDHTFWNIVRKAGYDVCVDNLPITPDGFPFTSDKKKDIANWVYKPLEEGMLHWRKAIGNMDFDDILSKVKADCLKLIEEERIRNSDLSFLQFSFLDRIGHVFSFKEKEIIIKSYTLAYELIDRLFKQVSPQYLIVISDHGFWEGRAEDHYDADCAVTIFNDKSYRLFAKNGLFKSFATPYNLNSRKIRRLCKNLSVAEKLQYIFRFDYVRQVDIFGAILKIFDIDYKKTEYKIPKKEKALVDQDEEAIKKRLERLGYL